MKHHFKAHTEYNDREEEYEGKSDISRASNDKHTSPSLISSARTQGANEKILNTKKTESKRRVHHY